MLMQPFDFVQIVERRGPVLSGEKLSDVLLAKFLLSFGGRILGGSAHKVLDNLYELMLMCLNVFGKFYFEGLVHHLVPAQFTSRSNMFPSPSGGQGVERAGEGRLKTFTSSGSRTINDCSGLSNRIGWCVLPDR